MIKLLRRLISSHNPVNPTDEERAEFETLFEKGLANYAYNIELGDGYLISEKGRKIISQCRQRDMTDVHEHIA